LDPKGVAEATSKGNAAVIAVSQVAPVAVPGILRDVPGMLLDPLGPLAIRWTYLPRLAPWLLRFVRASAPDRVEAISLALRSILAPAVDAYVPLLEAAGISDMLRRTGWLGVYESETKYAKARRVHEIQRRRGVVLEVLPQEQIRQFEPSLAPIYRHAIHY